MTSTATAQRIAEDIWNERDITDAQDAKWYTAEADLDERTSDEVYDLLVSRLAAR